MSSVSLISRPNFREALRILCGAPSEHCSAVSRRKSTRAAGKDSDYVQYTQCDTCISDNRDSSQIVAAVTGKTPKAS